MPIPDFQTAMRPLLEFAKDGAEHSFRDALDALAVVFGVTEEERRMQIPSGRAFLFTNRIGWAKTHLRMAGLIENRSRGVFRITKRGLQVLAEHPERVDMKVLNAQPGYERSRTASDTFKQGNSKKIAAKNPAAPDAGVIEETRTPEEIMSAAYQQIREALAEDLLERMKRASPEFFEKLVVELLLKMGYGGTLKDAGKAIGKSGDEGIDGVIKEDRLGLDTIYIQAKRWDSTVGRPEIQKFAGALQGMRAKKGVFITTGSFSSEARAYAERIDARIVLLGGEEVAWLMIDFGLGVSEVATYQVKRVDSDYFDEE
jgi:restriction system protein